MSHLFFFQMHPISHDIWRRQIYQTNEAPSTIQMHTLSLTEWDMLDWGSYVIVEMLTDELFV